MGRVYLAEQAEPQREVALKVIRSLASGEYLQRFRREAELLAGLEHPQIARIYQAGTAETAGGPVPYLAMEYIRGVDLAEWARHGTASFETKLRLIAALARAVQHAHARGVIHRDLKPGNVLVDAQGEPHILDFGVARMVGDEALTRMTAAGEVLGTLPYMSLEQLTGDTQAVDTRSDVYALGVIAYELLAGRLPHPELPRATLIGAIETLRGGDPPRLARLLPAAAGDVETIVMKAMAREAAQRYSSAAELAADIERYLAREPIAARPPTAHYLLGLYLRRHKVIVGACAFALLALLGAGLVAVWFGLSESEARRQAEARLAEREAVNEFITQMLTAADPANAKGEDLTMRETLASARMAIERRGDMPPNVRAAVLRSLGSTYANLGSADAALSLLEKARAAIESSPDADFQEKLAIEYEYINALTIKGDQAEALRLAEAALAAMPADETGGQPLYWRLRLLAIYARSELGQVEEAHREIAVVRDALIERNGETDRLAMDATQQLAALERLRGDYRAAANLAETLARLRATVLGDDHPETLHTRNGLATHLARLGNYDEAERILREVLAARQRVLGADHSDVWRTQQNLAVVLLDAGKTAEGAALMRPLVELFSARHGAAHRETLRLMNNLATAERDLKHLPEGERLLRRVIELQRGLPPSQHEDLYLAEINLAINLKDQRRYEEALPVYRSAIASAERGLPAGHPNQGVIALVYGEALIELRRWEAARSVLEPAHALLSAKLGADHPRALKASAALESAYRGLGRFAEADRLNANPATR